MIPRIKKIETMDNLKLLVTFDDGIQMLYDVAEDVDNIPDFLPLRDEPALFDNYQLDQSRTCITWSDRIDLPSDTIYEYGKKLSTV